MTVMYTRIKFMKDVTVKDREKLWKQQMLWKNSIYREMLKKSEIQDARKWLYMSFGFPVKHNNIPNTSLTFICA
jgi:hypothetical protein